VKRPHRRLGPVGQQQQHGTPRGGKGKGKNRRGHAPNHPGTRHVPTRTRDEEAPVNGVAVVETAAHDDAAQPGVSNQATVEVEVREQDGQQHGAEVAVLPAAPERPAPVSTELARVDVALVPAVVADAVAVAPVAAEVAVAVPAQQSPAPLAPAPVSAPVPGLELAEDDVEAELPVAVVDDEDEHEEKDPIYLDAGMYVAFAMSVVIGVVGQGLYLSDSFGESLGAASKIVGWGAGGFLEIAMIGTCDGAFKYRGKGAKKWGLFLAVSCLAAGFATYTNFAHWMDQSTGMAVTFGAASLVGFLVHVIHRWVQSDMKKAQVAERAARRERLLAEKQSTADAEVERRREARERAERAARRAQRAASAPVEPKAKPATAGKNGMAAATWKQLEGFDGPEFAKAHPALRGKDLITKFEELHPGVKGPTDTTQVRRWRRTAGLTDNQALATTTA
jgi:hypothetical protein